MFENDIFWPSKARKQELLDWLLETTGEYDREVEYSQLRKAEILDLVMDLWEMPQTLIETLAESEGHRVLFLPQYHPELNAVEYCWAFVKGYIRRNPAESLDNLLTEKLPEAFAQLTPEKANNICSHVIKMYRAEYEKEFGNRETVMEEEGVTRETTDLDEDDMDDEVFEISYTK